MTHLVLFDIDGTLVHSADFDSRLYARAVRDVLGLAIDTDWSKYENVTDSGILREVLQSSSWPGNRQEAEARVEGRFVQLTREYVARDPGVLREVPGAGVLFDTLARNPSVRVAIATGGWRETAMLKLHGIGIDPRAVALATGSDAESRCEIMRIAERRALEGLPATRKTYFGDGVWDGEAAKELDYGFIAVGDGAGHHTRFGDLSDLPSILSELDLVSD